MNAVNIPERHLRRVVGTVPGMGETRLDRVTAALLASVIALSGLTITLIVMWLCGFVTPVTLPQVFWETPGVLEGADEAFFVESPPDATGDTSVNNEQSAWPLQTDQAMRVMESVQRVEADALGAGERVNEQMAADPAFASDGSAFADGDGSLGPGHRGAAARVGLEDSTAAGPSAAQRWRIEYPSMSVMDYARALDGYEIELGCAFPDGRLVYLSELSGRQVVRHERLNNGDARLFMSWEEGTLQAARDRVLFQQAGVDTTGGRLLHFLPGPTETLLNQLERDFAKQADVSIQRTWFRLQRFGDRHRFVVVSQTAF